MSQDTFQEAVRLARAGERERACALLADVVEDDPRHAQAWLWLSGLLPSLDEQIVALRNFLKLKPNHAKAQRRLARLQAQQAARRAQASKEADDLYVTAVAAIHQGQHEEARDLLLQAVAQAPRHEAAWLRLSEIMLAVEDQIVALENVLTLNPDHADARRQLQMLQETRHDLLALAGEYRYQGRYTQARATYQQAQLSNSAYERVEATRRLAKMEKEISFARTPRQRQKTLLRLALGPPLLYALLVFVQIGFNLANLTALYCLGGLGVVIATLIINGLQVTPRHPLWRRAFGMRGIRPLPTRIGLWALGLLAMLLPFLLLANHAAVRLDAYRTAVFGG